MRVLVTGGAGYVGGFAARHLARAGHEVVVLDSLELGHRPAAPEGSLVVGDLEDLPLLEALLEERGIEAILHFAALSSVGESVAEPERYWDRNVAITLGLLRAMRRRGVRKLVFSSTAAVYGTSGEGSLTEDSPLVPDSPYGQTKLAIEWMIESFARAYGLGYVVLRYFNAAGGSPDGSHGEDHRNETHLIPRILRSVLQPAEPLVVFGDDYPTPDGSCVRDYIHVDDLARAHELALEACPDPRGGERGLVLNVGTGRGNSVLEVIAAAERVTGRRIPFRMAGRRPGDPPSLVASPERIQAELGWTPRYTKIEDIVATAWAWHRAHPDGYTDR